MPDALLYGKTRRPNMNEITATPEDQSPQSSFSICDDERVNRDIGTSPIRSQPPKESSENPLDNSLDLYDVDIREEPVYKPKTRITLKANGGSLLRLFQSECFDSHFHMHYLFKRSEQGVHDYLVNLLYKRPDEEIHFYLPQLCQIAMVRHGASALPRFILDKAAKSMHLALKAHWFFQAAFEDKLTGLSDVASKLREEIEMAVVNSKPSLRDSILDRADDGFRPVMNSKTPDLFLRRKIQRVSQSQSGRAIKYLTRGSGRKLHGAPERAFQLVGSRFPSSRVRIGEFGRACSNQQMEGNASQPQSPASSPGDGNWSKTGADVPSVVATTTSESILHESVSVPPLATSSSETRLSLTPEGRVDHQIRRSNVKGRIAPGFISNISAVGQKGSKIRLPSVYHKLQTPFNYTSFSRESHSQLLDDNEMQPYIIKQRRCEYFNLVGLFIAMLIEVSDKLALEPDKALRVPLVHSFLTSLNEWMLCRRCIVAASEGIFAMTGLLVPFTHFGVEPERATLGVPTPFQAPFLLHPSNNVGCYGDEDNAAAASRFSSVQILRICVENCRVFSSKKRAPYLMVFELADLDEDISQVSYENIERARDQKITYTKGAENPTGISWESLHVYKALLKELQSKQLFIPSFCNRSLRTSELNRIYASRHLSCEVCENDRPVIEEPSHLTPGKQAMLRVPSISDVFPFECPKCQGTKLFYDAITQDQMIGALRRSLGVNTGIGRNIRPVFGSTLTESFTSSIYVLNIPPPMEALSVVVLPPNAQEHTPRLESSSAATSQRRASLSPSTRLMSPGRSHSAGKRSNSGEDNGPPRPGTYSKRSSSVGPSPRVSTGSSENITSSVGSKKSAAPVITTVGLPSIANLLGSAAGLVKPYPAVVKTTSTSLAQRLTHSSASSPKEIQIHENTSSSGFADLYNAGETPGEQASRVRRLLWPETWDDLKTKIRKASPYGHLESWQLGALIVKGNDDVRQELLASQLVRQFKAIFDEANLKLWLRPYEILVTGSHSGIMEYVPDTLSIDAIKKRLNVDSVAKVFDAAFGDNPYQAKRNFIESHAAYSLLGYLLQVKDRHNGNLLLDARGRIVHIDFGFMLANSPGYVNFETSPFKLSAEIMAIMDGEDSENFEYFKELVVRGFLETRKHSDRILLVVEMMLSASKMACFAGNPEAALSALRDRFMLNILEEACIAKVLELISLSVNNWRTAQYDNFQRLTNGIL